MVDHWSSLQVQVMSSCPLTTTPWLTTPHLHYMGSSGWIPLRGTGTGTGIILKSIVSYRFTLKRDDDDDNGDDDDSNFDDDNDDDDDVIIMMVMMKMMMMMKMLMMMMMMEILMMMMIMISIMVMWTSHFIRVLLIIANHITSTRVVNTLMPLCSLDK